MHFAFDEDQQELARAVRQLLEAELGPGLRERAATEPSARRGELWKHLAEQGVFALLVPEEAGGLGLTEVDTVLVLEELGRAAALGPVTETFFVGVPILKSVTNADPTWLPAVATGDFAISAGAEYLPDGDVADLLMLVGDTDVVVAEAGSAPLVRQPGLDRTRLLVTVPPTVSRSPLQADRDRDLARQARDHGALATAAQLLGAAQHVLDAAVTYAGQRQQFGRQIGSYQSVKHQLANVLLRLEFARPLVYRAAYSMTHGSPAASRDVSAAKVAASEAADLASRTSLQVHGAIGYTEELDLQFWLKRIWSLIPAWGDATTHRGYLADVLTTDEGLSRRR